MRNMTDIAMLWRFMIALVLVANMGPVLKAAANDPPYEESAGRAMGTTYRVKLVRPAEGESLAKIEATVVGEIERLEQIFSLFREDSEIAKWNRAAAGEWIAVSPELAAVTEWAIELARKTDGALDPTVGPLVRTWRMRSIDPHWKPPATEEIAAARRLVGIEKIELDRPGLRLRKLSAGVELDLNAVVEGYTIDRCVAMLEEKGVHDLLVELGGEFRSVGKRGDGGAWTVGIENPKQAGELLGTVSLNDLAVSTSGDYRQAIEYQGTRYSHLFDPRTGAPIQHNLMAVSVVHPSALVADGWATALLVLGPEEGKRAAEREGLAASLVLRQGQDGPVWISPKMKAILAERPSIQSQNAADSERSKTSGFVYYAVCGIGSLVVLYFASQRRGNRAGVAKDGTGK